MTEAFLKKCPTDDRGNGLAAALRIPVHTLIHREPATLGVLEYEHLSKMCSYCFTFNPKFPPKKCSNCKEISYCSERCQRKDWPVHKQECVFINKWERPMISMMRMLVRCLVKAKLEPLFLESLNGLVSNEEYIPADQKKLFIATHMMLTTHMPWAIPDKMTTDEVVRIGCILKTNTYLAWTDVGTIKGMMLCPRAALFNHSCDPNAEFFFDGRIMRVASLRNIEEGDEVTVSYIDRLAPKTSRQLMLRGRYDFTCKCPVCLAEPEGEIEMTLLDRNVPLSDRLKIVAEFLNQGNHKLFTYYMRSYLLECHSKFKSGDFPEARKILQMLIEPPYNDLKVNLADMAATRDLYLIGMICEQAVNGVDKITPVSLMMQIGRDQVDALLKEPPKS